MKTLKYRYMVRLGYINSYDTFLQTTTAYFQTYRDAAKFVRQHVMIGGVAAVEAVR